jgi:predicted lipid-binding transport protein (Tim44 family)
MTRTEDTTSRLLRLSAACALALAATPGSALAAAGGGSSGFSGGGGGGGGSHGGGGFSGGGGAGGLGGEVIGVLILIALVIFGIYWAYRQVVNAFVRERLRVRRNKRVRRVALAAAEAAEDDPDFAPDNVRAGAETLFRDVQWAWDALDRDRLKPLVGADLLVEWTRRLDNLEKKGWRNHVQIVGDVDVEYVGLVNRTKDEEDRAVVRFDVRLRDYVVNKRGNRIMQKGSTDEMTRLREYWTLGKRAGGGWMVLSIEQDVEGAHHLEEEIVASPWGDDQRLRDEALVEGAVADKVLDGYKVADVADLDFDGDARAAALDLSLADGRFAPDVLEAAARATVAAWAEAVDGDDAGLLAVATPEAASELLHPGGHGEKRRLVVRGPRIKALRIVALDAGADPPTMTLEVDVRGRRYVQDRDTAAVLSGDADRERDFTERWLMGLNGDDRNPWRIVDATAGGRAGARSS